MHALFKLNCKPDTCTYDLPVDSSMTLHFYQLGQSVIYALSNNGHNEEAQLILSYMVKFVNHNVLQGKTVLKSTIIVHFAII